MKKVIRRFLFFIMAITLCTPVFAMNSNASPWALEEINRAYSVGLVPDELMGKLQDNITRKEFCALAMNFYKKFTGNNGVSIEKSPFFDDQTPYVTKAYELGVIEGVNKTTFLPNDPLMREQLPSLIVKTLQACEIEPNLNIDPGKIFQDTQQISPEYYPAIRFFAYEKIISGYKGHFYPKTFVTVEQAVLMFLRTYDAFYAYPFTIGTNSIRLGETKESVISRFGNPDRIDKTEYGFLRYIYNHNLNDFIMIGIQNDKVCEIFSNAAGFRYKNIQFGKALDDIIKEETLVVENNKSEQNNYTTKETIYFDIEGDFTVDSVYLRQIDIKNDYTGYNQDLADTSALEVFDMINSARNARGLPLLIWSENAEKSAQQHSENMVATSSTDYIDTSGKSPFQRMEEAGIATKLAAETICVEQREAISIYQQWMQQIGTRSNLLNPSFQYAGIGSALEGFRIYTTMDMYQ